MSSVERTRTPESARQEGAAPDEPLVLGTRTLHSRLILGTGGFRRLETLAEAIRVSGRITTLIEVRTRRMSLSRWEITASLVSSSASATSL